MKELKKKGEGHIIKYNDQDYKTQKAISKAFVITQKLRHIVYSQKVINSAFIEVNAEFIIEGEFLRLIPNDELSKILVKSYKLLY